MKGQEHEFSDVEQDMLVRLNAFIPAIEDIS